MDRLASTAPADVAIPQPVLAEIAYGIERLPRSRRRTVLQARFDLVCSELPRAEWTDAVSQAYGRIKAALERQGTRIEDFDAAIVDENSGRARKVPDRVRRLNEDVILYPLLQKYLTPMRKPRISIFAAT